MTRKETQEFLKVLEAHQRTIGICEACAVSSRDLAAEVKRGGLPKREDLQRQIEEAERVLEQLALVKQEVERVIQQAR
jgi:sulfur relay (sulfurtransferase) complex TusBCD TusD component (DsrE family)